VNTALETLGDEIGKVRYSLVELGSENEKGIDGSVSKQTASIDEKSHSHPSFVLIS
jgi:hypothetical protein